MMQSNLYKKKQIKVQIFSITTQTYITWHKAKDPQ